MKPDSRERRTNAVLVALFSILAIAAMAFAAWVMFAVVLTGD